MSERKVGLIGVPLGFAAEQTGSELGVSAMRLSRIHGQNLAQNIRRLGYEVVDRGDAAISVPIEPPEEHGPKYLGEMIESSQNIFGLVSASLAAGETPVILGGDHSIAVPTFSAISTHYRARGESVGLIYVDAHADINTPETSPSGNIHGMPLAILLGHGPEQLVELGGFAPKLSHGHIVHIGARDVDPGERSEIERHGLRPNFFTMSDVDKRGIAACMADALEIVSAASGGYAVTFDVDAIDPRFAPGSGTLVRGGLTYREAHLALEMIADDGNMRSFEIVEVNPLLDQSNITVELACELILSALGKTIL